MHHKFFINIKTVIIHATFLTIWLYFDMKTLCYQTTLTLSPFVVQSDRYLLKKISQLEKQIDGDWTTHEEKIVDFEALFRKNTSVQFVCLLLQHTEEYQNIIIITYNSYIDAKVTKDARWRKSPLTFHQES